MGRSSDPVLFSKAIADETRQKIMSLICCREMCVSDLVEELGNVSQPTVSHHLQILRSAGLAEARRDGKMIYYTLRQEAIADCCRVIALRFAPEVNDAASATDNVMSDSDASKPKDVNSATI